MNRIKYLQSLVAVGSNRWPGPRAGAGDWPKPYRGSYMQASTIVNPRIGVDDVDRLAVHWSVTSPDLAQRRNISSPIVIGDSVYVV